MRILSQSIEDALSANRGEGPGFSALRLALALAIVFVHCFVLSNGSQQVLGGNTVPTNVAAAVAQHSDATGGFFSWLRETFLRKHNPDAHFANAFVLMFFALSGFLVAGSAFRTRSLSKFLTFRALRIVPALFVEVVLSALVLGPLLTSFSYEAYFANPKFFEYFGNIIGRVRFELPGLFLSNPLPSIVNGNLWTLPAEFYCYLITAALMFSGVMFRRAAFSCFFVGGAISLVLITAYFSELYQHSISTFGMFAIGTFFCGAMIFHWREYITLDKWLFAGSVAVFYLTTVAPPSIHAVLQYVDLITLSYLTVYIGFIRLPNIKGDYSYGIYLYGFPLAQMLVATISGVRGQPYLLMLVAVPQRLHSLQLLGIYLKAQRSG